MAGSPQLAALSLACAPGPPGMEARWRGGRHAPLHRGNPPAELITLGRVNSAISHRQFYPVLGSAECCFPESGPGKPFSFESIRQLRNCDPGCLLSFLYFGGPQPGVGRHIRQMLNHPCRAARNWLSENPGRRSWTPPPLTASKAPGSARSTILHAPRQFRRDALKL